MLASPGFWFSRVFFLPTLVFNLLPGLTAVHIPPQTVLEWLHYWMIDFNINYGDCAVSAQVITQVQALSLNRLHLRSSSWLISHSLLFHVRLKLLILPWKPPITSLIPRKPVEFPACVGLDCSDLYCANRRQPWILLGKWGQWLEILVSVCRRVFDCVKFLYHLALLKNDNTYFAYYGSMCCVFH